MLPGATQQVPASLMTLLAVFSPLLTAPSFRGFCGLACGFLAQPGKRTVCGMLTGAGLARAWPHDRAHYFFSRARWDPDELGLGAARLVVSLLVPAGAPVDVAVDDTLLKRRGKKVWAASWFHDGSAHGPARTGYGNNWVVLAVIVRLPVMSRPVAVPVMAKLVIKDTNSKSRLWLARRMAETAIEDAKQVFGTGQARNRAARAVERSVPFQIACQAIAVTWYATVGHDPAHRQERRANAP